MKFAVVELKNKGRRLSRGEISSAPVTVGNLLISDWKEGNAEKRALRKAEVMDDHLSCRRGLLWPLFDPMIIRMEERWFVLKGYQLDAVNRVVTEYAQEWLVRPYVAGMELNQPIETEGVRHPHQGG
jgi:hypothetical protein